MIWISIVLTLKDLDSNYDGYVNEKEFLSIFEGQNQQEMSRYFSQDLDTDHDGKLDLEELSIWIDPKNFVPGKYFSWRFLNPNNFFQFEFYLF